MTWIALALAFAHAAVNCELGRDLKVDSKTYKHCEIGGHSGSNDKPTYYVHCDLQPEDRQIEFVKGIPTAQWMDSTSRALLAQCKVKANELESLITDYGARVKKIENQKCYLGSVHGQVALFVDGKPYRCSFKMNAAKSQAFKNDTGRDPSFQCEGEHFLISDYGKNNVAFAQEGTKWRQLCLPSSQVGQPVEDIDWKNPPEFYDPNLESRPPAAN